MSKHNTMTGYHIVGMKNGALTLNTDKLYTWNIPRHLRHISIQQGDIVRASTNKGKRPVLVQSVFREETKETSNRYENVMTIIERAPANKRKTT